MRIISVSCLFLVLAVSCSKERVSNTNPSKLPDQGAQAPVTRPDVTVVETSESKKGTEIRAQASELLVARNYDKLEEPADKYRASKECNGDGLWKLREVYAGMIPAAAKPAAEWETRLRVLREWIKAKPESITAHVALADALVCYAWKARGGGYAGTVTEDGWNLMGQRLNDAVQVLKEVKSTKEKCPFWWSVMLRACLGLGVEKDQYQKLFEQAIRSEPGFTGYYCQMAYYLLPRWHGEATDTANFLQRAADQIGGDDGDLLYARVAWYLQGIEGNVFDESKLSWERADKGFQVMEKMFGDSLFVRNGRAYMAVMGCPKTLLPRRLVTELDGKIDPKAWSTKENFNRLTKNLFPG